MQQAQKNEDTKLQLILKEGIRLLFFYLDQILIILIFY